MKKTTLLWIIAIIITLGAAYYQRKTGPTYSKKIEISINDNLYFFYLPRSHGGPTDCPVSIKISNSFLNGNIFYRRFPTNEPWKKESFIKKGNELVASLPNQPPAGKLQYYIILTDKGKTTEIAKDSPIIIRFKGDVPVIIIIPHVLFMFIAMFLSNLAGLFVIGKIKKYIFYTNLTFIILIIGGFILGPIMQYYAFGKFWTGFPIGYDLTDNKTLIAVVGWLIAVLGNIKKGRPYLTLFASILLLVVYSIPHSLFGSELDYTTGEITTGFINYFLLSLKF